MESDVKRLQEIDRIIQQIAREMGLDFFEQEFDVIPAQKMLEIMAYRFPVNFSHWSFGRDYERERTKYEHGLGIPYEVVLNSDPCRAFLMNTNPFAVQVMVMAHVYAHNDFMKNNIYFGHTRRDMLPSASEAALRFQRYEKLYGLEAVEQVIDAGLSIELNIDPDFFIEQEEETPGEREEVTASRPSATKGAFDDLLSTPKDQEVQKDTRRRKTPERPQRDLMLYIIQNSPKPLREWEQDVLSVIRDQSRYFMPQRRTKIMNEGWATLWHMRIMDRLFREGILSQEDHGYYNLYNARVLAKNPRVLNPYLVGLRIFEDVERRWDRGQFGREFDLSDDPSKWDKWDKGLGKGREKIFEVRRAYSDRFFVEHFLTERLVEELELYLYEGRRQAGEIHYVIKEKGWRKIKELLVASLSSFDTPLIFVEDGDFQGKRELYLRHAYEGMELDPEYRQKTMEKVHFLWDRPVHLESVAEGRRVLFTFDGREHTQRFLDPDESPLEESWGSGL
jgi:stage V sporulation protein R